MDGDWRIAQGNENDMAEVSVERRLLSDYNRVVYVDDDEDGQGKSGTQDEDDDDDDEDVVIPPEDLPSRPRESLVRNDPLSWE